VADPTREEVERVPAKAARQMAARTLLIEVERLHDAAQSLREQASVHRDGPDSTHAKTFRRWADKHEQKADRLAQVAAYLFPAIIKDRRAVAAALRRGEG
jgi:propanediol dehydratase small subunit